MKIGMRSVLAVCLIAAAGASASLLTEDFEGSSAGSTTPPSGWSLVTVTGSPTYTTTASGQGSNGSGGSSGLAGQVYSSAYSDTGLPGGYLVHNTTFDLAQALSGSFDFMMVQHSSYDDVTFILGDVADGLSDTSAGELLSVKTSETPNVGGVYHSIFNGTGSTGGTLASSGTALVDDTWYHAIFSWTPSSGLTGDLAITVTDFSSDLFTMTVSNFTYDSADGQVGFGSVNDIIRFDNVNVIPEPSSLAVWALGGLALVARRRILRG